MKKYIPYIFGILLSIPLGWYAYQKYELLLAEKKYAEYMAEPKSQIFLWNRTNLDALAELRYKTGNVIYSTLTKNGATSASYPAGELDIVVKFSDGGSASFEGLSLGKDLLLSFEIHKDSIEPQVR